MSQLYHVELFTLMPLQTKELDNWQECAWFKEVWLICDVTTYFNFIWKCNLVSPKLSSHKKTTKKSLMHQDEAWPWTICRFRAAKPWLSVKDRDCEQQAFFMTAQRISNCSEHGHSVCDMSRPVLVKIPSLWKFPAFWKWYTSLWVLGLMRNPRKSW